MPPRVLVSIVTCNSERYLKPCLTSVQAQTWKEFTVCLWDNASSDASLAVAAEFRDLFEMLHSSNRNVGFCAAHNQIIAANPSDYVLVLNPDVWLEPSFLATLVDDVEQDATAGSATGKLWRWDGTAQADGTSRVSQPARILDTAGIYLTPNQRHLDRGSGERDRGAYEMRQYVFGASGAAAFYRRAMLEDVKEGAEYFDESFFAYREDADLAWRAQWLGWRCIYVPQARGLHVRRVLPERRAAMPPDINMHSFKNRFLLRIKNLDAATYALFFLPITARDFAALGYVLLRERYSLKALPLICKAFPRAWRTRKDLIRRRRITPHEMRNWFRRKSIDAQRSVGWPTQQS